MAAEKPCRMNFVNKVMAPILATNLGGTPRFVPLEKTQKGQLMSTILLVGPAVEPVTLAEAKSYLRVQHDDDDDVIAALIAGARVHVEAQTRRALITQS